MYGPIFRSKLLQLIAVIPLLEKAAGVEARSSSIDGGDIPALEVLSNARSGSLEIIPDLQYLP